MRYRVTTTNGKVLIANDEAHLAEVVQHLKDDVKSVKQYSFKTKKRKNLGVLLRFTEEQKQKYQERALSLGCKSLQDYLKILLLMDTDLKIFVPAKKATQHATNAPTSLTKLDLEI